MAAGCRYARSDATHEQLESAARTANNHDFVESLSEGYETVVGERGYRLSGGEKQRVAIAQFDVGTGSPLTMRGVVYRGRPNSGCSCRPTDQ